MQLENFNTTEESIYRCCVKNKKNTPTSIASATGLQRTTVQSAIERLIKNGFLTKKVVGKKKYITPIAPRPLFRKIIAQKEKSFLRQKRSLEKLLHDAEQSYKENLEDQYSPTIFLHKDMKGMRLIIKTILRKKEDIYWYGSMRLLTAVIPEAIFYREMTLQRMKTKTTLYGITDRSILKDERFGETLGDFRMFRFYEKIQKDTTASFAICGDMLIIVVLKNHSRNLIEIKDPLVSNLFRTLFLEMWEHLPKI